MRNVSNKKASKIQKFKTLEVKSADKIKGGASKFIIIEDLSEG